MIRENFKKRLKRKKYLFVSVATSDLKGNPNSSYKLLIKIEGDHFYLFDYPVWRTWQNVKQNPKVAISLMDDRHLRCYKMNGTAEILEEGPAYDSLREEIETRRTNITVKHIVEAVHNDKDYKQFEDALSDKFVLYKVKVEKLDEMTFAKIPEM